MDFFDRLNFGEMISASDGSERTIEARGTQPCFRQPGSDLTLPWVLKVEAQRRPAIEFSLASREISFPEPNAASDIAPREIGMDHLFCDHGNPDWITATGMEIRESDDGADSFEISRR